MEVKVDNVFFSYSSNKVINNFSCFIKDNMISAIVGSNCSGKSTIVNLISGLFEPISGNIKVGDLKVNDCTKKIGYLPQFCSGSLLYPSVYLQIESVLNRFCFDDVDRRIRDVIKLVGLDENFLSLSIDRLSNAQLKRVYLASILAYEPELLILDEPLVGIDNKGRADFLRFLKYLKKKKNMTIIIVSSDTDFVHSIADYVFLLKDGSIYLEGDKYDVLSNEEAVSFCGLKVPNILHFSNLVMSRKNIKIGYRDEINDLIKDVYRYVR